MKVLVTGGAGYIGSHTVHELVVRGYDVLVLDTLQHGHKQAVLEARFIEGDIADGALLEEILQSEHPDAVMHFAALKAAGESMHQPAAYFRNNVCGLLKLLDTMVRADIRYCIYSSSCSIFGTPQSLPVTEDASFSPESVYAETKLMGETLLKWFDQIHGLKYSSLRYFNAAGASLDNAIGEDWSVTSNLIPLVMKAAVGKAPLVKIFGIDYPTRDGTAIRDYIHVVDLAVAHVQALEHLILTQNSVAYNLGTGNGSTVLEVIETAKRISGVNFPVEIAPRRPGDPAAIWADSSKAERELGWKAKYDLEMIIRTAWTWHSTHPQGFQVE
jgi:UDP-glucose-4-epimerase GalE